MGYARRLKRPKTGGSPLPGGKSIFFSSGRNTATVPHKLGCRHLERQLGRAKDGWFEYSSLHRSVRRLSVPLGMTPSLRCSGAMPCSNRSRWAWSTIPDCTYGDCNPRLVDACQDLRKKIGLLVAPSRQTRSPGRMIASSSAFALFGGTILPLGVTGTCIQADVSLAMLLMAFGHCAVPRMAARRRSRVVPHADTLVMIR